jgi:hypothetical protein
MPPVRRPAGGLKPAAIKPAVKQTDPDTQTAIDEPKPKAPEHPWSSPASVIDSQGLSMMLFSMAGIGKTTLGTTMLHSLDGGPMLIVNLDEELRSISDLSGDDVMVWPGEKQHGKIRDWQAIESFTSRLKVGSHPFKSIMFDTLNSLYDKFAMPSSGARGQAGRDPRQIYGEANDLVLRLVGDFCALAREKGLNVLFTCHAEEKQVGENGPLYIRPKITPGVVQGINQRVSMIGYLAPPRMGGARTLQLAASAHVATKIHQPRSGPQVPGKITDPDLGLLIDHIKHHKPYPTPKKDKP